MNKARLKQLLVGQWSWWRLARSLVFIYTCVALYVFLTADRKIFIPQPASYRDTEEILKLTVPNGNKISARYLSNPTATYTILYAHGNAEDLGDIEPILQILYDAGFSVFAYDYRGYGTSEGHPTERHAYEDIDAAYSYLTQKLGISPQKIIAYGRSVGGGSAVDLASRQPVAGLILESTFTQAFRVVIPFPVFPFDKFRNLDKIQNITCPVLIIHGMEDTTVPFSHGRQLFQAAPEPKLFLGVEGASHNDLVWVAGERYLQALREFARVLSTQHSSEYYVKPL
ncbi:MAG: alpha/beta hydrolase [Cyanobacteriota bacterium]|nr:alpha/beta hydrolase [Cyanobacteriota bacterium]